MASTRIAGLDALRGGAIALMMIDHVAALAGGPWWLRGIVTRFALPMFMFVAGYLWRPGWRRRHLEIVLAALATLPLVWYLEIADVHILAVYALVLPLLPISARWPWLAVAVGLIQAHYWSLDYLGYEPGLVWALVAVGQLAQQRDLAEIDYARSWLQPFTTIGRRPLSWYTGHLAVLAGLVWLAG